MFIVIYHRKDNYMYSLERVYRVSGQYSSSGQRSTRLNAYIFIPTGILAVFVYTRHNKPLSQSIPGNLLERYMSFETIAELMRCSIDDDMYRQSDESTCFCGLFGV